MERLLAATVVVSLLACNSGGDRAKEQLAALQKKKEADAQAKKEKEDRLEALPADVVRLEPPWDDSQATVILPDGPCPEGWWALFPGDAPGATPEEKKANQAKRTELAAAARAKPYVVKLRAPTQVVLAPYDAPGGKFSIDVQGTIDCTDSIGRIAIAWSDVHAGNPGASAAKQGAEVTQNYWLATPVHFELPMTSLTEAKAFYEQNRYGLSARVGLMVGKTQVDRKLTKIGKVSEQAHGETLGYGGGTEDWGAGRLVQADKPALRVATERERKLLFEKRN